MASHCPLNKGTHRPLAVAVSGDRSDRNMVSYDWRERALTLDDCQACAIGNVLAIICQQYDKDRESCAEASSKDLS